MRYVCESSSFGNALQHGLIMSQVLFYHSNCKVPGVYGVASVHKEGYPDCESVS
jgi:predicted RNA-binding protein with PUA-like domain